MRLALRFLRVLARASCSHAGQRGRECCYDARYGYQC
jgi:hypothetical protein